MDVWLLDGIGRDGSAIISALGRDWFLRPRRVVIEMIVGEVRGYCRRILITTLCCLLIFLISSAIVYVFLFVAGVQFRLCVKALQSWSHGILTVNRIAQVLFNDTPPATTA